MSTVLTAANQEALESDPTKRAPLVLGEDPSFHKVTEAVSQVVEMKTPPAWLIGFLFSATILGLYGASLGELVGVGTGEWGMNHPVGWAWDITGFVFWIGIGHAGTLISAILFLFRQKWRTSINRAAEAMTIFAVVAALQYPLFHTGRPWFAAYWLLPIPNQMNMWPNFRSPLEWDVFAVSTYGTVSILFWFVGLVPDMAILRDRATTKVRQVVYGIFSLGWRGSHRHWVNYERAYLMLAGLSTPLVLSVHTIVSFDFATSVIPGWHTTIFPPYFVAGAIFSGFAMVLTLMLVARKAFGLEHLITLRHIENMNKVIVATGTMVGYAYGMEFFTAWYSGNDYEQYVFFVSRATGPYAWAYWTMISCNVIFPQVFWSKKFRTNIAVSFVVSLIVNIGMWFERFVIIATSLHRDFLPSSWGYFQPRLIDITFFLGTFGLFMTLFMLFLRFLPAVAVQEVKAVLPQADPHGHHDDAHAPAHGAEGQKEAAHGH